jgi:alcohol dehydrogenase, propanol-preferring
VRAVVLEGPGPIATAPLRAEERTAPQPGAGEVRIQVSACACCRTDLHIVEGDLELPRLPVVPGHQVIGVVDAVGDDCTIFAPGDSAGVFWLHWACGECPACRRGDENLCPRGRFTGWTDDGGYADALTVPEAFAVALPPGLDPVDASPLLCAGVIGYRALRFAETEPGERVALLGFGSSAHIAIQVLTHWGCEVAVLTRGAAHRALAQSLGAAWVGNADDATPAAFDRAIVFAPAGDLVPVALRLVRPGGTVVMAGIHMTPIPAMEYATLWGERTLRSVANATRRDAAELIVIAIEAGIRTTTQTFPLESANEALAALAASSLDGAAVLVP